MRVSSSQIYNIANLGMANAQSALTRTQEQIATGKRLLSPADDPVASTAILQLSQQLARTEQYQKNIDIAENNLQLEEVALQSILTLTQRMKELAVRAGNTGVLTSADYQALASEVESRMEELFNLQNTRNASGQYVFAGYQGGTPPFAADGGGNYSYRGDEGQLRLQVSETVTVPVSDNGKRIFMEIPASHNTFNTRANPSNQAQPPATISVGQVIDQAAYDRLFPEDLVITFNAYESVNPSAPNYSITERGTGRILVANEPYISGEDIEVAGVRFSIGGSPYPGTAPVPANLPLTFGGPVDFSVTPATLTLTVGGISETLVLDQDVNNPADLLAALGSSIDTVPGSGAERNAAKLANLGLVLDPVDGLVSANGLNIQVRNGSADTDTVTGLVTQGAGTTSTNGELGQPGDSFSVNATNKQGLLTTLSRLSVAMREAEDTPASKAELNDIVAKTLTNLENAITNMTSVQGEVGARLNTLDSSRDLNLDTVLYTKKVLSELQDLDYAEASTRLAMESFVLSAAQQSFVKVSQLNLFNYL